MAQNSKIEWTDHTVNLWWGCSKVHTGCKNCYAEVLSETRYKNGVWGDSNPRKIIKSSFNQLNKIEKIGLESKVKQKVFVGSMMDIFEDSKRLIDHDYKVRYSMTGEMRAELFSRIHRGEYDNIIFLFLTKRPENMIRYLPVEWYGDYPSNVWLGTSISQQIHTEYYISRLINSTPSKSNLFLSIEPQVDDITRINLRGIDWVIQGGESGSKKRSFNSDWAIGMRYLCVEQNVPYFFKQIDKKQEIPEDLMIREFPKF